MGGALSRVVEPFFCLSPEASQDLRIPSLLCSQRWGPFSLLEQRSYCLSDLRVSCFWETEPPSPVRLSQASQLRFPVFLLRLWQNQSCCFWGLPHGLGAGPLVWLGAPSVEQQTSRMIRGIAPLLPSLPLFLSPLHEHLRVWLCGWELCLASTLGLSFPTVQ